MNEQGERDQRSYRWSAINGDGKKLSGVAKAESVADVYRNIIGDGLIPDGEVRPLNRFSLNNEIQFRSTPHPRALALAADMMASMQAAGLDMLETLDVVIQETQDPILRNTLTLVRQRHSAGIGLDEALAEHPTVFPPMMINLVHAGTVGGGLGDALHAVAETLDKQDALRSTIRKAMVYPIILTVACVGAILFMLLFFIPRFSEMFEMVGGEGTQLPLLTRAVVAVSNSAGVAIPVLLAIAVPALVWFRKNRHNESVRAVADPLKLKLPIFGPFFLKIALARSTRDLSRLLSSGVDRLQSLEIAAKSAGNKVVEDAWLSVLEMQRRGRPMARHMRTVPVFPAALCSLVESGERANKVPQMLGRAVDLLDRDVDQTASKLTSLITPLFTIGAAIVIGVMMLALYLPYLDLGDMISSQ